MNITEIAKLAGVSKAAVSRYFQQRGYLSAREAARLSSGWWTETGYAPNVQAQMLLRTQQKPPDRRGAAQALQRERGPGGGRHQQPCWRTDCGYQLMLASTANDPAKEVE
jgi:LacI family sucrose operon transcriptional repressor